MNSLLRFLQVLLCFRIYGSLAEENLFLSSDSESGPLLPLENTVGGEPQLSLGLDSASSVPEDSASDLLFPLGDASTFSISNGDGSVSDLFSSGSIANLPLNDGFISSNEGLRVDDPGFSSDGLLASSSGASCLSDADGGQFISRIKRRDDGKSCTNSNVLNKDPTRGSDHLPPNPNNIFPPPGSRQDRLPGSYNDPKPRNPLSYPAANTEFDFKYCPSGVGGLRQYAVCDSGFQHDRVSTMTTYTLYHVTRLFDIVFSCFNPHRRWCCENYVPDAYGLNDGFANFCTEQLIDEFFSGF